MFRYQFSLNDPEYRERYLQSIANRIAVSNLGGHVNDEKHFREARKVYWALKGKSLEEIWALLQRRGMLPSGQ